MILQEIVWRLNLWVVLFFKNLRTCLHMWMFGNMSMFVFFFFCLLQLNIVNHSVGFVNFPNILQVGVLYFDSKICRRGKNTGICHFFLSTSALSCIVHPINIQLLNWALTNSISVWTQVNSIKWPSTGFVPLVGSIANFNQDHIWLQLQGEENSKRYNK